MLQRIQHTLQIIEPKHTMYLNHIFNSSDRACNYIEPKHTMYLNFIAKKEITEKAKY